MYKKLSFRRHYFLQSNLGTFKVYDMGKQVQCPEYRENRSKKN